MRKEEVYKNLTKLGFRECKSKEIGLRVFLGKNLEGPNCECNDRSPPFQIFILDVPGIVLQVDVRTFGQICGQWVKIQIELDSMENFIEQLDYLHNCLSEQWKIFVEIAKRSLKGE